MMDALYESVVSTIDQDYQSKKDSDYSYSSLSSSKDIADFNRNMQIVFKSKNDMSKEKTHKSMKAIKFNGEIIGYIGFSRYNIDGKKYLGIGNFMIIPRYQSSGHGTKVIKDLIDRYKDTYDEIYCYVEKENTKAIQFYKRIADVNTKNLTKYGYYVCLYRKGGSSMNESNIINQKDIYYNKDKFDSGEINLCFITGHSGSGKSTMARSMQNSKVEHYELDDLNQNYKFTDENLKEYGDLIYSFFKGPGKKYRYHSYDDMQNCTNPLDDSGDEFDKCVNRDFVKYVMKYANSHKNTKFVIEGIWLYFFFKPEELKDYAVYIKGTSRILSAFRAAKRDSKDADSKTKRFLYSIKGTISTLYNKYSIEGEKLINKYRDYYGKLEKVDESYIEESLNLLKKLDEEKVSKEILDTIKPIILTSQNKSKASKLDLDLKCEITEVDSGMVFILVLDGPQEKRDTEEARSLLKDLASKCRLELSDIVSKVDIGDGDEGCLFFTMDKGKIRRKRKDLLESYIEESKTNKPPLYFYHMVNSDANLSKGLLSLGYMYHHDKSLFLKNANKYRNRLCDGWGIYPGRDPKSLTAKEIYDGIKKFRKEDNLNTIYFFRYPPYSSLDKRFDNLYKTKKLYRINLNDPKVKSIINNIHYGWTDSNTDNDPLNRNYYENISIEDYFNNFDPDKGLLFSTLHHISIEFKNGYIPMRLLEEIEIPNNIDDVFSIEESYTLEFKESEVESKSIVYFTKDITPQSLLKIYQFMTNPSHGVAPLHGNIGVKISTGEYGGNNFLQSSLIKELVDYLHGVIVECNTAYVGKRNTTEDHWNTIKSHGFLDIANCDIMDENGDFPLPVKDPYHIKNNYVGSHLKRYDSILMLSHFEGHSMAGYGGALKNMSIGMASSRGKLHIHTAGEGGDMMKADRDKFLESMVDADMSVMDYMGRENILYVNVANNLNIDCDCDFNPKDPDISDIGIFASTDPVALDQACIDAVYHHPEEKKRNLINRITSRNGMHTIDCAYEKGLGNKEYVILDIDQIIEESYVEDSERDLEEWSPVSFLNRSSKPAKNQKAHATYLKKKAISNKTNNATAQSELPKYNQIGEESIEEAVKSQRVKTIFIVTSYTNTAFGKAIKTFTHSQYTHAAIAFDTSLEELYSFNADPKYSSNGYKGGISKESLSSYIDSYDKTIIQVNCIFLKPSDFDKVKETLDNLIENKEDTSYGYLNILNILIGRAKDTGMAMVCSQFVSYILSTADIRLLDKPDNIVTPKDLSTITNPRVYKIFEGYAKDYEKKRMDRIFRKLKTKALLIKENLLDLCI